jgi:four helix bundle protein
MPKINHFKELRVWQTAVDLAMEIFHFTKEFPKEERYSLTDQIRRSSRSVAANISEAWRKRRYEAAFISKLNDSESEAAETQTWLEIAVRCGYLERNKAEELSDKYEHICSQLVIMIKHPENWILGEIKKKKK